MPFDIEEIFAPCQPSDFIGQTDITTSFINSISEYKQNKSDFHSFLIVGDEGTGKSSLLLKLASSITGRRDQAHIMSLIPDVKTLQNFFKEWKNQIDDMTPDWRSVLEKVGKRKLGDSLPFLGEKTKLSSGETIVELYTNKFMESLDKIDQKLKSTKTYLYFFFDNLHLFKLTDNQDFYPIFASILKKIHENNFNIVTISAFNEKYLFDFDYQKLLTEVSKILRTEPLSVSESEIYIRRKFPTLVSKGALNIVSNSQRTYFDINLGIAFISKDLTIEDFVERNLSKLFDLSVEEEKAFVEFPSYNDNLFPLEQITNYIPIEVLKNLEKKGILWMGNDYLRLVQEGFLSALKFRERLYGPLPTLIVNLESIITELLLGIAPSTSKIEQIKSLTAKIHDQLADFVIASKLRFIIKTGIEQKMFQFAYDFALINAALFEEVSDFEQAGIVCEEVAREFEEKSYNFAAKLYVKSGIYYKLVNEDLKAKRSNTRAADQFEKLAFSIPQEGNEYAIRGYIKSCLECCRKMSDVTYFDRIRKKALVTFDTDSIHHEYFNSMQYEEKEQKMMEIEVEQTEDEKVSLDDLEKELDF